MDALTSKYRVFETNVLLERFLTYREVFTEYFKTMKVIERGEALRYETYSRLADNYLENVHRFIEVCNSYITKYHLEETIVVDSLDNYFIDLINGINCLNLDEDVVDHLVLEESKRKIQSREVQFVDSIRYLTK